VVRDDNYFQAADRGETYVMPPELTEEEERRAFPGYEDALALLVAPPTLPRSPPMQPRHTPPARPRREAKVEP
jgi:hypothetical protein